MSRIRGNNATTSATWPAVIGVRIGSQFGVPTQSCCDLRPCGFGWFAGADVLTFVVVTVVTSGTQIGALG